jgi:uncharacterized protein (TIGR02246 family)
MEAKMTDVDAVNAVSEAEAEAISSADEDAMVRLFTEDCVLLPPDAAQLDGHQGVRDWLSGLTSEFEVSGGYSDTEVEIAGDTAIQRYYGELRLTPREGGDQVVVSAKGLHVMKRQADGSWKIWQDIWNLNPDETVGSA